MARRKKNTGKVDSSFEVLQELLQLAAKLELYTLPLYLYAYYSLKKPGGHEGLHLREVIMEEMLHMGIVSNIMHSIENCRPPVYSPIREFEAGQTITQDLINKYVPYYPDSMPIYKDNIEEDSHRKYVEDATVYSLDKLSLPQIVAFMEVELPESGRSINSYDHGEWKTIGEFYDHLKSHIVRCKNLRFNATEQITLTTHNPTKQDNPLEPITNVRQAIENIDFIVEQGEGAAILNIVKQHEDHYHYKPGFGTEEKKPELAHFYHFYILYKKMGGLQEVDTESFSFCPKLYIENLDCKEYENYLEKNINNLVKNPAQALKKGKYPKDALIANLKFNINYSELLDRLSYASMYNMMSNFGIALDQMNQFHEFAQEVTKYTLKDDPSTQCGPTFQYLAPDKRSPEPA
ncbi:MAG: ferritin-like domain-containing protein [Aurantibacter sp.]